MWLDHLKPVTNFSSPYKFTGKQLDEESGLYYFGARYLDPRYSRWMSTDPALGEYIPTADRDQNKNLPGMGGVFNVVNFNLYHYAGNNPVRYTDPDGRKTELKYSEVSMDIGILELGQFVNKSVRQYAQGIKNEKKSWFRIINSEITNIFVLDSVAGIAGGATKGAVANGIKRGFVKQGIKAGIKGGLTEGSGFIWPAASLGLTAIGLITDYFDSVSSDNAQLVKDFNKIATFWDDVSEYDDAGFDCRIMLSESFSYTEAKNGEIKIKDVNLILRADIYNQDNGKYEATVFTSLISSHYSL